jgi:hypothetical protein
MRLLPSVLAILLCLQVATCHPNAANVRQAYSGVLKGIIPASDTNSNGLPNGKAKRSGANLHAFKGKGEEGALLHDDLFKPRQPVDHSRQSNIGSVSLEGAWGGSRYDTNLFLPRDGREERDFQANRQDRPSLFWFLVEKKSLQAGQKGALEAWLAGKLASKGATSIGLECLPVVPLRIEPADTDTTDQEWGCQVVHMATT